MKRRDFNKLISGAFVSITTGVHNIRLDSNNKKENEEYKNLRIELEKGVYCYALSANIKIEGGKVYHDRKTEIVPFRYSIDSENLLIPDESIKSISTVFQESKKVKVELNKNGILYTGSAFITSIGETDDDELYRVSIQGSGELIIKK